MERFKHKKARKNNGVKEFQDKTGKKIRLTDNNQESSFEMKQNEKDDIEKEFLNLGDVVQDGVGPVRVRNNIRRKSDASNRHDDEEGDNKNDRIIGGKKVMDHDGEIFREDGGEDLRLMGEVEQEDDVADGDVDVDVDVEEDDDEPDWESICRNDPTKEDAPLFLDSRERRDAANERFAAALDECHSALKLSMDAFLEVAADIYNGQREKLDDLESEVKHLFASNEISRHTMQRRLEESAKAAQGVFADLLIKVSQPILSTTQHVEQMMKRVSSHMEEEDSMTIDTDANIPQDRK